MEEKGSQISASHVKAMVPGSGWHLSHYTTLIASGSMTSILDFADEFSAIAALP